MFVTTFLFFLLSWVLLSFLLLQLDLVYLGEANGVVYRGFLGLSVAFILHLLISSLLYYFFFFTKIPWRIIYDLKYMKIGSESVD